MKILTKQYGIAMTLLVGLVVVSLPVTANAQKIAFVPDTLYMGKIPTTSRAVRKQMAYNLQSTTLEITGIEIQNDPTGSFTVVDNPGSASLGILQKLRIDIEFKPTAEGLLEADLVYTSNSADGASTVHLYGEGLNGSWTYFERVFGPEDGAGLGGIVQTSDGGYFMSGSTPNLDTEVSDIYLAKTDRRGDLTWSERIIDDGYNEGAGRLVLLSDGNYLLFGSRTRKGSTRADMQLMKIDETGTIIWRETYGGDQDDSAADILATADGGFLLCGTSDSFPRNGVVGKDIYLVKVDHAGVEQWFKTYGGDGGENAARIIPTSGGGYMILASSTSWAADSQDQDIYLVKIASDGEFEWGKTIGDVFREGAADIAELPNGGYAVVGYSQSGGSGGRDMYLASVDAAGVVVWERYYGEEYQDGASNVLVVEDGIIIAGSIQVRIVQSESINNQHEYSDMFVIKTDFDGNEMWRYQYGGQFNEGAREMILSTDGSIVITGGSSSYAPNGSVFFLNFSPSGDYINSLREPAATIPSGFHLNANYPNPFNNSTVISYDLIMNSRVQINIYNLRGQKIRTLLDADQNIGRYSLGFNASELSSGVYFYELQTDRGAEVKKMLLLK